MLFYILLGYCIYFLFLHSSTRSCHRHPENISLRPAVSVLAPASRLRPRLALLRGVPAARGRSRGVVGRHQVPQFVLSVAADRRSEGDERRDRSTADWQCVRAEGEGLQQGWVWRVQWRRVPAHSTGTWWDTPWYCWSPAHWWFQMAFRSRTKKQNKNVSSREHARTRRTNQWLKLKFNFLI